MFILLTGNHPRHLYFVKSLSKTYKGITWILEKRESFIPKIDKNYNFEIQKLQKLHFSKREEAENTFFGDEDIAFNSPNINQIIEITKEDIFNGKLKKILISQKNKNLITYGCSKLPINIVKLISGYKWNVHGGLSPWYRGVITHFWPSYMLEPEYTGVTLHELTEDIDGGDIIHQAVAEINIKDGIHENACRLVKNFSDKLPKLLKKKLFKKKLLPIKSNTTGRIWTGRMWSPIHLKLIYKVYNDKINKYCFENKKIKKPKIKSILIK